MILQKIKDTFGDCKYPTSPTCDNCEVKSSYQDILLEKFYIYDSKEDGEKEQPVRRVESTEIYQLTVYNKTDERVTLIKTDKCLLTDNTKKCDCVFINDKQCFLVEISESIKNRSKKRRKAVKQIEAFIQLCIENNIDLSDCDTKAVICFKHTNERPTKSSNNTRKADFRDNYSIDLIETNHITFE